MLKADRRRSRGGEEMGIADKCGTVWRLFGTARGGQYRGIMSLVCLVEFVYGILTQLREGVGKGSLYIGGTLGIIWGTKRSLMIGVGYWVNDRGRVTLPWSKGGGEDEHPAFYWSRGRGEGSPRLAQGICRAGNFLRK